MTPTEPIDPDADEALSDRRVWRRPDPKQGSYGISLTVMGVLYDAGEPLSLDALIARVGMVLDPYQWAYIEAWYLHVRQRASSYQRKAYRQKRNLTADNGLSAVRKHLAKPRALALRHWIKDVFLKRIRQGHTLAQDPDGRYRPGPRAPMKLTHDGKLIRYTPEARQELAHADHAAGREHLVLLEWKRIQSDLDLALPAARAQLVAYLARRLLGDQTTPLDERKIRPMFDHIDRIADTPAIRRAVFLRMFADLFPDDA